MVSTCFDTTGFFPYGSCSIPLPHLLAVAATRLSIAFALPKWQHLPLEVTASSHFGVECFTYYDVTTIR